MEERERPEKILVVTNNRSFAEKTSYPVDFVEGSPVDVLVRGILLLQSNYRLVPVPPPPSVPAMRAPIYSLLLEESDEKYDLVGIEAVERIRKAMARQRAIGGGLDEGEAGTLGRTADFASIDETYLERAVRDYLLTLGDSSEED